MLVGLKGRDSRDIESSNCTAISWQEVVTVGNAKKLRFRIPNPGSAESSMDSSHAGVWAIYEQSELA